MPFVLGIIAALAAPLTMTLGFIVWDNCWTGSPFALNMFKCSLASIGFVIVSATTRPEDPFSPEIFQRENVGYLMLSSVIGIVIGDWTWLEGLRLLGARRVIVMDSLKPFLAAVFGWALLDERLRIAALGGIVLTVAGILLVSLESETEDDGEDCKDLEEKEIAKQIHGDPITVVESAELSNTIRTEATSNSMCTMGGSNTVVSVKPSISSLGTGTFTNAETGQPVMMDKTANSNKESEEEGFEIVTINEINIASTENQSNHLDLTTNININSHLPSTKRTNTETRTRAPPPTPPNTNANKRAQTPRETQWGVVMSIINVVLDTYGSVLTKDYGSQFTTWEINLVRFGFAGAIMLLCSILLQIRDYYYYLGSSKRNDKPSLKGNDHDDHGRDEETGDTPGAATAVVENGASSTHQDAWYKLPLHTMSRSAWMHVIGGVLFVTFFTPALSNYALFQIALALALTLGSVGPLYALPLTYALQKHQRRPTLQAFLGAVLAVAGIVVLAFWGTLD